MQRNLRFSLLPRARQTERPQRSMSSRAIALLLAGLMSLLLSEPFAAGEEQTTGVLASKDGEAQPGPIGHDTSSKIGLGTKLAVFCSLGLTALALLGHMLHVRAEVTTSCGAPGAVSGVPNYAEMSELPLGGDSKRTDGLRRRSHHRNHAVEGTEGSKQASLPLHKLIEAGDTNAVQSFVSHNSPELVQELFNMGDPALNGTTPLLLALRLGKDDIATLLLVRRVCTRSQK